MQQPVEHESLFASDEDELTELDKRKAMKGDVARAARVASPVAPDYRQMKKDEQQAAAVAAAQGKCAARHLSPLMRAVARTTSSFYSQMRPPVTASPMRTLAAPTAAPASLRVQQFMQGVAAAAPSPFAPFANLPPELARSAAFQQLEARASSMSAEQRDRIQQLLAARMAQQAAGMGAPRPSYPMAPHAGLVPAPRLATVVLVCISAAVMRGRRCVPA